MIPKFTYARATSVQQAVKQSSALGTMLHAGGTDLLGCLRDRVVSIDKAVSISGISELRGIKSTKEGGLSIGALMTLAEVADHPLIAERYAALAQGAASAASPQLRNQGTLGGNLCQRPRCWYFRGQFHCLRKGGDRCYAVAGRNEFHAILGGEGCYIVHPSDTAPGLMALEALVRVVGPRGARTIPLNSFFVGPDKEKMKENVLTQGDVITEILLPPRGAGHRSSYRKVRARGAWDFALAGVALSIRFAENRVAEARIVLSGVAPVPWRSAEAEKVLIGQQMDQGVAQRAAEACVKDAVPLSGNEYKIHLTRGLVHDALLAL